MDPGNGRGKDRGDFKAGWLTFAQGSVLGRIAGRSKRRGLEGFLRRLEWPES